MARNDSFESELSPIPTGVLWEALKAEPSTGLSVVGADGTLLYMNEQAAAIFLGPRQRLEEVLNQPLASFAPEAFAAERVAMVRRVLANDEPILLRGFWHGMQHYSWLYPIHGDDEADGDSADRVLVITRRSGDGGTSPSVTSEAPQQIDAQVIDLGDLSVLTRRELVVLAVLGRGMSYKEAAALLRRSPKTIETQATSITRKLGLRGQADMVRLVSHVGLTVGDSKRTDV